MWPTTTSGSSCRGGSAAERLVLVNAFDDGGTPCVLPDDRQGEHDLVAALIAAGHRRIGFLTLPPIAGRARPAARGLSAGAGRGRASPGIRRWSSTRTATARPEERAADPGGHRRACWRCRTPPTVLCCGNDRLAVTVYGILRARGIAVPEGMSVAGLRRLPGDLGDALSAADHHGAALRPHGRGGGAADARANCAAASRCRRHAASSSRANCAGGPRWCRGRHSRLNKQTTGGRP